MGLLFSKLFKRAPEADRPSFDHYVDLTDKDISNITMGIDPPSTITWVEGEVDVKLMEERVKAIVSANPWLAGKFIKDQKSQIKLGYNDIDNLDDLVANKMIQVVEDQPDLGEYKKGGSYTKLMKMVQPYLLKAGADLKPGQPIWKLAIVKPSVLIVTMTHAAGDGSTYYDFFQMLLTGKVQTLPVERVAVSMEEKSKLMGHQEARLLNEWGYIFMFVRGLVWNSLIAPWWPLAQRTTGKFLLADNERIKAIKQSSKLDNETVGVPYISTNDIITSWFFSKVNLPHATMVMDTRSRGIKGLNPGMVGNYQDILYYRKDDIASPQLLRKSILNMKRTVTDNLPIRSSEMAFSSMSIITNWASFANLKAAVGMKVVQHLPVSPIETSIPSTAAVTIVFEARPGQTGMLIAGTPDKLKGLEDALPAPFQSHTDEPFLTV